jgi:hypothetical protein
VPFDEIWDPFLVTRATGPSKDWLIDNHLTDHVDRGPEIGWLPTATDLGGPG